MKLVPLLISAVVLAVAPSGVALAATHCAPPGNSGVDQYFETIPGGSCNEAPGGSHHGAGGGGGGGSSLPPGTTRELNSQGGPGQAVVNLVNSTAPSSTGAGSGQGSGSGSPGSAHHGRGSGGAGGGSSTPTANPRNFLSALLHPIISGSPGGIGFLLPAFLALVLVLVVAGTFLRRRGRRGQDAAAPT